MLLEAFQAPFEARNMLCCSQKPKQAEFETQTQTHLNERLRLRRVYIVIVCGCGNASNMQYSWITAAPTPCALPDWRRYLYFPPWSHEKHEVPAVFPSQKITSCNTASVERFRQLLHAKEHERVRYAEPPECVGVIEMARSLQKRMIAWKRVSPWGHVEFPSAP